MNTENIQSVSQLDANRKYAVLGANGQPVCYVSSAEAERLKLVGKVVLISTSKAA